MIKIIESFVERNTDTGELTSYYIGQIVEGTEAWEALMISEGHAVNYTYIEPTGSISITENREYDVTSYATANVNVAGGSSDFTTATVTFINSDNTKTYTVSKLVMIQGSYMEVGNLWVGSSEAVDLVLYKGSTYVAEFEDIDYDTPPVVTGSISYDADNGEFIITGDGSITLVGTGQVI